MPFPPMVVNKSANMKSVTNVPVLFLVSVFVIYISSVCGIDPETILPNNVSQTFMDKKIRSTQNRSATQVCTEKYRPNQDVKQNSQNNPYFSDPNDTFDIIPVDSTHKLPKQINQATVEKPDEKQYQDKMNDEVYNRMQKKRFEAVFESLAEKDNRVTNIFDSADAKANMEAVFGICTTEGVEPNKKCNRLNTADKDVIDKTKLMDQITDIFGPPPINFSNINTKRKNNYQGIQAAIYKSFGPEVLEASGASEDLGDRFIPRDEIESKSGMDHTSIATGPKVAQSSPESRQIYKNSPGFDSPESYGTGRGASLSLPQEVSTSSIASSSAPDDDVDDPPSSTSFAPTAPSRYGASAQEANSILLNNSFNCSFLMAALVVLANI